MIFAYKIDAKHRIKQVNRLEDGSWIHAETPSEEELIELVNRFDVDSSLLKDALDPHEVPRSERENGSIYVYTRTPEERDNRFVTVPVLFIIQPKQVITVSGSRITGFDPFESGVRDLRADSPVSIFITLMEDIITRYYTESAKVNRIVSGMSKRFDTISNENVFALVGHENILNEYLNAMIQTNVTLKQILSVKGIASEQHLDKIEDLFLASGQLLELLKSSLHNVKNIRDAYSTIMTNNLNRIIKLFTVLTVVFTIPTIIASFYGMNVDLPIQSHPLAFYIIFLLTTAISLVLLYIFVRKKWL